MHPRIGPLALLAAGLLSACADADDAARAPWLRQILVADNRALAERDPDQTAEKYRKMAASPYAFFRATLTVFLGDARRPGPGFWPTAFGSGAASRVLALGDPHVENFGSFENGTGEHTVEVNDFDGATFGPYHLDVRRLALGFHVGGTQAGLTEADRDAAVHAALAGYVAEIQAEAAGEAPVAVTRDAGFGAIVDDLLRRAERDGDVAEELDEYTRVVDGVRVPWYGVLADPEGGVTRDELVPLTAAEYALLDAVLAAWPGSLVDPARFPAEAFTFKGASRRLGAGVSSFPVVRFYAVLEGPTADVADDWLLEIKELPEPAAYGDSAPWPQRPFADNGERAVLAQRTWQGSAQADPLLGHVAVPPMAFRVRHRTKHQKGVDLARITEKLAEGDWRPADVLAFATVAGRLVARGHGQSPTLRGGPPAAALAALIGDGQGFIAETQAWLAAYAPRFFADFALFQRLLEAHGPLLGYRRARDLAGLPQRPREPVR